MVWGSLQYGELQKQIAALGRQERTNTHTVINYFQSKCEHAIVSYSSTLDTGNQLASTTISKLETGAQGSKSHNPVRERELKPEILFRS